jgi:plasmid stabilization system protein ParE
VSRKSNKPSRKGAAPNVQIVWSPLAVARLADIGAFVALDKPEAAERLGTRIVSVIEALRLHPRLGRASGVSSVRELVLGTAPYVIYYRLRRNIITILDVRHGAQDR